MGKNHEENVDEGKNAHVEAAALGRPVERSSTAPSVDDHPFV
jgi:hypothetical protein